MRQEKKSKNEPTLGWFFLNSSKQNLSKVFIRHVFGFNYTYEDTIFRVAHIIQFFNEKGIKKGDRIVCYWEDTIPGVMFSLACAISGVILVPLSPIFSSHYLKNLMAQNSARVVFTTLEKMPLLKEADLEPYCADSLIDTQAVYIMGEQASSAQMTLPEAENLLWELAAQIDCNDTFMIQPTSGSTGQPKLVIRPHISPCRYGKYVGPQIIHEEGNRPKFLMVAALTHAFGFNMLATALSVGAELLVPSRIDASAPLREVKKLDPSVIPLVPRILRSFFLQNERSKNEEDKARLLGPSAKYLISAGGSGDPTYFQTLQKQGVEIMEIYGSSEASMVALTPRGAWRPGYAGKILPDVELKIEEDGELLIRSPGMMKGYFNDEKTTAEAFSQENFYLTGDLGHVDTQGYLQILGRKKDIFNTAEGSNIYPERLENLLEALPSVKQAILIGDRRPYISVMIVVHSENLFPDLEINPKLDLLHENKFGPFYDKLGPQLRQVNSQLERVEQIVRYSLFNKPFDSATYATVGPGKARRDRRKIEELYADRIEALYATANNTFSRFVPGMDRRMRPHSDLRVHLIWNSKDHRSLISLEVGKKLKPIIKEICHKMGIRILSGNIASNHVHLLISYPPELSVSEIASNLKGSTSSKLIHSLPGITEEAEGKNLWDQGYLAVTSGNLSGEIMDRYILTEDSSAPLIPPVEEQSILIPLSDAGA